MSQDKPEIDHPLPQQGGSYVVEDGALKPDLKAHQTADDASPETQTPKAKKV